MKFYFYNQYNVLSYTGKEKYKQIGKNNNNNNNHSDYNDKDDECGKK